MASFAELNAKFAIDFLYLLSQKHPDENIMFSPVNLSSALGFLTYGSQCDKKVEPEKVLSCNKEKESINSETKCLSETSARGQSLGSKQSRYLPKLPNAQTTWNKTSCRESSLFKTSEEGEKQTTKENLVLLAAETILLAENIPQADAEEESSLHYVPWRKHLTGMEESENLTQENPSAEGKVTENEATAHKYVCENLTETSSPTAPSRVEDAIENLRTMLSEFRHTVKCADNNAQTFKESWLLFKECCDNMCTSMSNLQGVLESLITVLRE
ncbi:uncharacterized protein LOC107983212 [Anolis carolinensis]|uniref:uncharacterized protein LOC107983212 n=1 Tax=Anolis carolinensis TaxID=28377 RepID=UPI002F2B6C69